MKDCVKHRESALTYTRRTMEAIKLRKFGPSPSLFALSMATKACSVLVILFNVNSVGAGKELATLKPKER